MRHSVFDCLHPELQERVVIAQNRQLGGPFELCVQGVERLLSCGFFCRRERGSCTLTVHYAINYGGNKMSIDL